MKNLLLMAAVAFMFSACSKCVECTQDYNGQTEQWTTYDPNTGNEENYGDRIMEVCSDNFDSKKDFNDYIEEMEDNYEFDCKSDFWN
jgi:hypothetical protein